ncbi:hypothetical protein LTR84_004575 [Exophiala bonariae]|uniref:Post-SET domain-containing protein n=1 Tax=Exophiala bonariae TaxID=1690606 RepID=A0AAV9NR64_9EURO|nr:hypothetical protein LTR84_004575 [Exophiala bonariae]
MADQQAPKPTHPEVIQVVRQAGAYSSYAIAVKDFDAGDLIARLETPPMTITDTKRYSSVQISENQNIELNTDFLFINHSCEPSVEFHVKADADKPVIEVRAAIRKDDNGKLKGIKKGELFTFFYPSTEWDMAQPFDCKCGTKGCLGRISGAKDMTSAMLNNYFLNEHIENLRSVRPDAASKLGVRSVPSSSTNVHNIG